MLAMEGINKFTGGVMTITDAIQAADKVLAENYLTEPPIDVYELAKNYGLEVVEVPFPPEQDNISGFVSADNGVGKLYVNANEGPNRRRFTVAHELGHWKLHQEELQNNPQRSILFRIAIGQMNQDPIEKEANVFAANLLVPLNMLKKYKDSKTNSELAKLFNVSTDVIGYRLKLLERPPDVQEKTAGN